MIDIDIADILLNQNQKEILSDDQSDADDDDVEFEEVEKGPNRGIKRKRAKIAWVYEKKIECELFVESEIRPKWASYKQYDAYGGTKVFYKCKYSGCPSKIYLFHLKNPIIISMFTNQIEHQHMTKPNKKRGISPEIKQLIKELYGIGVTGALNIIYALRDKKVPEDSIPSQRQIYNFINDYKKELYGEVGMTFLELQKWCEDNVFSEFASDDDSYVLDYFVSLTDQIFRLALTTNRLINLCNKRDLLAVDATYKIIIQGFPLMIAGTIDYGRHFHPIAAAICSRETTEDYEFLFRTIKNKIPNFSPTALVADTAGSISNGFSNVFGQDFTRIDCWAHVQRKMELHLKVSDLKIKEKILLDIDKLNLCYSQTNLDITYQLFKKKWEKTIGPAYFVYFENEWFKKHPGWYEGFAPGLPSTNNALEACNKSIKDVHTFRERVPLSQFLSRIKIILKRLSEDEIKIRKFEDEIVILDQNWRDFMEYYESKPTVKYVDDQDVYLLSLNKNADFDKFMESFDCDIDCLKSCETLEGMSFDQYINFNNEIRMVKFDEKSWMLSKCMCYDYFKFWKCKHILLVALSRGKIKIPEKYLDKVIGAKLKPGKKKKAKYWHERD